jgi:hypothetical protein
MLRRHFLISASAAFAGLASPQIIRAQEAQKHFFAGCYYDTALSDTSTLFRNLIDPLRTNTAAEKDGAELTPRVREIVDKKKDFARIVGLNDNDEGNPIALSVTRAQHEIITITSPGLPNEFLTTISVSAAVDVMTDKAAFRNQNRFESLYSTMIVVNQVIHGRNRPNDAEIARHYQTVFFAAVEELLDRTAKHLRDKRERASAVFQVKNMVMPSPLPTDIEGLITSGVDAAADKSSDARQRELTKLSREVQHIYSLMILDALDRAKITNVAILPPESPWTEGRVLRLLQQRLGVQSQILAQPDSTQMNGFEIRAGLIKVERSKGSSTSQINCTMGSRIVRRKGDELEHVPSSVTDVAKKIAVSTNARTFVDRPDFKRGLPRDVIMGAIRDSARGTATALVPLLKATAEEF